MTDDDKVISIQGILPRRVLLLKTLHYRHTKTTCIAPPDLDTAVMPNGTLAVILVCRTCGLTPIISVSNGPTE